MLGSYLAESLQHAGRRLEEVTVEVADLRELNQVIVDSIQSGLLMTDAEGRIRHVNVFGEGILGRRAAETLGRPLREVLGSPLLGRAELAGPGRDAGAGPPRDHLPALRGRRAGPGGFGHPPRHRRGDGGRIPGGVPGPHRRPAPRGRGADEREARGGRGDGGPAGPRDPQPSRVDPGLGPGARGRVRLRRGAGAAAQHHLAGVEAPLGHPEPLPLPGPLDRPASRRRGPAPAPRGGA